MIALIDYNMGNLQSVLNAFEKIGKKVEVIKDADKLKEFDKVILPGVGAFGDAMEHLSSSGLDKAIKEFAKSGKPLLGICLGMQLLTKGSEEGKLEGFGFIDAYTKKFKFEDNKLKIPHMGWNIVKLQKKSKLFQGMENQENRFYFVQYY